MKTPKILTIHIAVLLSFMSFMTSGQTQDALKQLNNENSGQNTTSKDENKGYIEKNNIINNDKIKETMSAGEFKNFSGAKAYIDYNSQYTLGPNDVINIIVMRHPEVSGQYIINLEGKIQYEFVGDVVLAGYTKDQAVEILAKKLSTYIIKPEVILKIAGYNSKIVYVVGEVATPGRIPMHGDTITVRDALLSAGLPLIGSAATDSASLFTPSASGNIIRKRVNVEALLYKGDLRENYVMHPGDCLYIPATFLTKAMRMISPVTNPISSAANTYGAAGAAKAVAF